MGFDDDDGDILHDPDHRHIEKKLFLSAFMNFEFMPEFTNLHGKLDTTQKYTSENCVCLVTTILLTLSRTGRGG